jgi:hypothetical protein
VKWLELRSLLPNLEMRCSNVVSAQVRAVQLQQVEGVEESVGLVPTVT